MNKLVSLSLSFIFVLCLYPITVSSATNISLAGNNLQLNGLAVQSELRSDWFINGLYLSSKADSADAILSDIGPKRMELKVLADNLSGRRLKRLWIERIRSNNPPSDVLAKAKEVRKFAAVVGQNLEKNDVLTIDYLNDTTVVSINGSQQAKFSGGLFNLVLNTWVGTLPPSNEYKSAILGKSSFDSLLSRYTNISPSSARVALFDKKKQEELAAKEKAEEEKRLAEERKAQKAKEEEERQRLAKLEEQKKAEEERQARLASQQASKNAEKEKLAREAAERKRLAEEAAKKPPVAEVPAGPSAEELAAMKRAYTLKVRKHYIPYFEYPTRAIMRKYGASAFNKPKKGKTHGTVKINLEIDRDGDLVSGSLAKSSGEKILDEAVQKAMFDAVPFPAMPSDLEGETFKTVLNVAIPAPK